MNNSLLLSSFLVSGVLGITSGLFKKFEYIVHCPNWYAEIVCNLMVCEFYSDFLPHNSPTDVLRIWGFTVWLRWHFRNSRGRYSRARLDVRTVAMYNVCRLYTYVYVRTSDNSNYTQCICTHVRMARTHTRTLCNAQSRNVQTQLQSTVHVSLNRLALAL